MGDEGEWDALFIGRPQVLNCGKDDLRMYYHSYDQTEQKFKIGLATSKNGIDWEKQGVVLTGTNAKDFDSRGCTSQCVVRPLDERSMRSRL